MYLLFREERRLKMSVRFAMRRSHKRSVMTVRVDLETGEVQLLRHLGLELRRKVGGGVK